MPIQIFIDDSGAQGQLDDVVFAGLFAEAEAWAHLSEGWQRVLRDEPSIRHFKMRDAARLQGQFHRFTPEQRDDKLRALARQINRWVPAMIRTGIRERVGKFVEGSPPINNAYFEAFFLMLLGIATHLHKHGVRERCEVIFDEHVIFAPRAIQWYPVVITTFEPELWKLMPLEPRYENDESFMPLQAADLVAWCCHRSTLTDVQTPSFDWLRSEIPNVEWSQFSAMIEKTMSEQFPETGIVPELDSKEFEQIRRNYRKGVGLD